MRLDAVEIALLLAERFFDAARPLGARGIGAGAVDRGELAFEPGADRISGRCGGLRQALRDGHGRQPDERQCDPGDPPVAA